MARDYKSSTQAINKKRPQKRRNATPIKWLCAGIALGVAIIVVLPQLPFASLSKQLKGFSIAALQQSKNKSPKEAAKKSSPTKKDASKQSTQPSFDFYTLLPEMKVDVPVKENNKKEAAPITPATKTATVAENKKAPEASPPPLNTTIPTPSMKTSRSLIGTPTGNYALQLATFKSFSDADAYKSDLLLRRLPVKLQTITTEKGEALYRIKIGPYKNKNSAERDKQKLVSMNFKNVSVITDETGKK